MSNNPLPPILALKIRYLAIGSLKENPANARTHPKAQIAKLKKAITQFGFVSPIILDENLMILAGHGRYRAALELGLAEVPTIMLQDMSEADVRAFVLADNIIADKAGYDKAILRSELQYLSDVGYEVEITGLDTIEIDTLLSIDAEEPASSDDVVAMPSRDTPTARLGDLWHIGPHRLLVGDARDPSTVERLMDGERAQLVFTDPPYGCVIANNVSGLGRVKHGNFQMGAGQESLPELATTILRPAFRNVARHCRAGAIAFVCSDWRAAPHMLDAATGVFDEVKNWIVWVKTNAGLGTFYRSQFEIIIAFRVSAGKTINNFGLGEGGRHRSNVWTYAGANTFRAGRMQDLIDHPTCKPRKLVADAILDCSRRGGIILDVFAGSGTTIVAAAATGRRGYGIEIDPKYADVILRRIAEQVGEHPFLDGREPLESVAAARRSQIDGGDDG
jgi:DNA modification methylase